MRTIDAVMAIPGLLLALLLVSARSATAAATPCVAIAIAFAPGMARITRSVALDVRQQDYVKRRHRARRGRGWIVFREMLPNVMAPIVIETTIRVAFAVMLFATLSFLGLGAQPPASEWGLMVADARQYLYQAPWIRSRRRPRSRLPRSASTSWATAFATRSIRGTSGDIGPCRSRLYARLSDRARGRCACCTTCRSTIAPGEVLGLVGESGSGKSSLAWAIMRHLPDNAREIAGSLRLGDTDLQRLSPRELTNDPRTPASAWCSRTRRPRSTRRSPSDGSSTEMLIQHRGLASAKRHGAAIDAARAMSSCATRPRSMRRYPHEVSGGEKQRVIIATAFACRPGLSSCSTSRPPRSTSSPARASWTCSPGCATRPASPRSISRTISRWSRGSPTASPSSIAAGSWSRRPPPRSSARRAHAYTRALVARRAAAGTAPRARRVRRRRRCSQLETSAFTTAAPRLFGRSRDRRRRPGASASTCGPAKSSASSANPGRANPRSRGR